MKLYEMPRVYEKIYSTMTKDEEVTDEEMLAELSKVDDNFRAKVENCAKLITQLEATAEGCGREIDRLTKRRRSHDKRAKWLKEYVQECMVDMGMNKVDGDIFRVSVQKNPTSVLIEDEAAIPEEFFVTPPPKVSKSAIKDAIDAGAEVPGCKLQQTESLRVR